MKNLDEIIIHFECHSAEGIKKCFANGVNPNEIIDGKPLIYSLINMYTRSPKFKDCVKTFVDFGLHFDDKILLAVLLDDAKSLENFLQNDPQIISRKYTFDCTYTPLFEASLLHICAEYNCVSCAEILVKYGIDINIKAGIDENGFGGQTPIFHTVNQNLNNSAKILDFLLKNKADLKILVTGLIWGKGYDWETLIPAVNPISYAMMGLLPQMHRSEFTISDVVSKLLKHEFDIDYSPKNVPNKYLKS
jgi:hypothetical protein